MYAPTNCDRENGACQPEKPYMQSLAPQARRLLLCRTRLLWAHGCRLTQTSLSDYLKAPPADSVGSNPLELREPLATPPLGCSSALTPKVIHSAPRTHHIAVWRISPHPGDPGIPAHGSRSRTCRPSARASSPSTPGGRGYPFATQRSAPYSALIPVVLCFYVTINFPHPPRIPRS